MNAPDNKTVIRLPKFAQVDDDDEPKKQQPKDFRALWDEWGLQRGTNGQPLLNLSNAVSVLDNDPELAGLVRYDAFLQRMLNKRGNEWSDKDDIELTVYVQRETGLHRMGRDIVGQAVITVAHKHEANCVREWMDGLRHDGVQRMESFFADCLDAEASEYTSAASRNFWISMVARVYKPGCKVDNMVVLEGDQGVGKSSSLRIIGGDYFAEQHESATNPKAFAEILQGKLLVEISEMDAFSRVEVSRVKQTISCQADRYRASYGRHAVDHPRQCVFVGTTNKQDWNRDDTGARRFWPVACGSNIRLDLVEANRDQLFAEAVARYKAGEPHWHMPPEATRQQQEARYQGDPWMEKVADILKGESKVTTSHIFDKLDIPIKQRTRADEIRIGKCLGVLKWKRNRDRIQGTKEREYFYYPPPEG